MSATDASTTTPSCCPSTRPSFFRHPSDTSRYADPDVTTICGDDQQTFTSTDVSTARNSVSTARNGVSTARDSALCLPTLNSTAYSASESTAPSTSPEIHSKIKAAGTRMKDGLHTFAHKMTHKSAAAQRKINNNRAECFLSTNGGSLCQRDYTLGDYYKREQRHEGNL